MIIIPISHAPDLASIPDAATRAATVAEMSKFRGAIHSMINVKSQGKLGAVTWEISRPRGVHYHWQMIPVPADLIRRGLVEAAFKVAGENQKYEHFQVTKSSGKEIMERDDLEALQTQSFFRVRIWCPPSGSSSGSPSSPGSSSSPKPLDGGEAEGNGESGAGPTTTEISNDVEQQGVSGADLEPTTGSSDETETQLVLPLDHSFIFDLQFGRKVLAQLLRIDDRAHWKDCVQSEEEETENATAFGNAFSAFDFSKDS